MTEGPTTPPPAPQDRRTAKAEAAAAKARAKATRPWYLKKRYAIPLAIILVGGLASMGGDDETPPETDPAAAEPSETEAPIGNEPTVEPEPESEPDPEPEPEPEPEAAVGDPAADGQFTFTVNGLECGATEVGEDPFVEEAQGQWCVLNITVENTGDEARGLSASSQYLYDTQDREFSAEVLFGVDTPIYEQINPGNSVTGDVYFDVSPDFEASHVILHDSAFSGGVTVALG